MAPLLASFEASLRELHKGNMPQISTNPITFEEVQAAKLQVLHMDPVDGLQDLIGEDGEFEEVASE